MFTEVRAINFKSWRRLTADDPAVAATKIDPPGLPWGRVTGLFGANSSGKTSILQIMLLLKQTAESADRGLPLDLGDGRSPVRLGAFTDVLRDHVHTRLGLGLSWKVDEPLAVAEPGGLFELLFTGDQLSFDTDVDNRRGAMLVRRFRYRSGANKVSYSVLSNHERGYELAATIDGDSDYLKRTPRHRSELPPPVKCYGFPDQVNAYFENAGFLRDLELSFEQQLRRMYYLGPVREVPQPAYPGLAHGQQTWDLTAPGRSQHCLPRSCPESRRTTGGAPAKGDGSG